MYKRRMFSKKACMAWMLAALTALGLGQALGLFLTSEVETAVVTKNETDPLIITGTVVRQEQVVYAPFLGFWETALDIQRVYAGQTLFTLKSQNEDAVMEVRLLSGALEAAEQPLPQRRENIHSAIALLQEENADAEALMALVLGEGEISAVQMETARESLAAGMVMTQTVSAPMGGIFVPVVDGLEELLSPDAPEPDWANLPETPVDDLALGRIITSDTWYFYGQLPAGIAAGDEIRAELLSGAFQQVTFTVMESESIGDGSCRVLCSCDENIASVAKLRKLMVKILTE